jgi:lysophospholipase L1-like esterase
MPLGASITYGTGSSDGTGYRSRLHNGLQGIASAVDFVGSVKSGTMTDNENEGYPGFTIGAIDGVEQCAVPRYQPNAVTLPVGTNDMLRHDEVANAPARLRELIQSISSDSPGSTVLVAGIPPIPKDDKSNSEGAAYTAAIPGVVNDLVPAQGLHVVYTDLSAVGPAQIGSDQIHPTDEGYGRIGDAFVRSFNRAAGLGWIRQPNSLPGTEPAACNGGSGGAPAQDSRWEDRGVIQSTDYPNESHWMVDINKDGKAEFVSVDAKQNIRFWWNSGPSGKDWKPFVAGENSFTPAKGAVGNALQFGDIDGDGFPDCMIIDLKGRVDVHTWKADAPSGQRMCMNHYSGTADVFTGGSKGDRLSIDPNSRIRFADVTGRARPNPISSTDQLNCWNPDAPVTSTNRKITPAQTSRSQATV